MLHLLWLLFFIYYIVLGVLPGHQLPRPFFGRLQYQEVCLQQDYDDNDGDDDDNDNDEDDDDDDYEQTEVKEGRADTNAFLGIIL